MSYKERERSIRIISRIKQNKRETMHHHLPVNINRFVHANLPINIKGIGDCQAAECALCAGCSDVVGAAWTNAVAFTSFSALYLCVSNNLLTHKRQQIMFVPTRA